jgi:fatty acid desaturase
MSNTTQCPNCNVAISQIEINCEHCNFPLSGSDKEKAIFIGRQIANTSKLGDAKESQAKAQRILYIIGAFQLLNALLTYFRGYELDTVIFYTILGVALVVFGFFSGKKPLLFLTLSLVTILGYYVLLYFINPNLVFQGILWKIVIIAFLVYGIWHTVQAIQLKKKHKFLKDD